METTFDRRNRGLVRHVDVFGGRCRTAAEQYVVLRGDAYGRKVGHSLKRAARIAQGKDRQNMAAVLRSGTGCGDFHQARLPEHWLRHF